MSNVNNVVSSARSRDVSSAELYAATVAVKREGGTIDDLMQRIDGAAWLAMSDEEKNARRASINVRRSNMLKRLQGEFQAERTDLENRLQSLGADTGDECNAIREELRTLAKNEKSMVEACKLSRKSRTGDNPTVSLRSLLTDAILGTESDDE